MPKNILRKVEWLNCAWLKVRLFKKMQSSNNLWQRMVLLLFLCPYFLFGQVYELRPSADFSLIGAGAVTLIAGQAFTHNTQALTVTEISTLNAQNVNAIDRFVTTNYSNNAVIWSDVALLSSGLAAASLIVSPKARNEWLTIAVMGIEMVTITAGVTNVFKGSVQRVRPFAYNSCVPITEKTAVDTKFSFFSGHTSMAAGVTFFAAKVFSDMHPNSKYKPLVWAGAVLLPALTGTARIQAGKHFVTDVIAGYAFGGLVGYLIPQIHLLKNTEKAQLQIIPKGQGMALKLTF